MSNTRRHRSGTAGSLRKLDTGRLPSRVRDALLESIRRGGFPDGLLPSEDELAADLGVSRATVRDGLRLLEAEGLVRRLHGIGTKVNEHVVHAPSLSRLAGFYDQIREAGHEPRIASTTVGVEAARDEIRRRLGRTDVPQVYVVERLFYAGEAPVVHLSEHVPIDETEKPFRAEDVPDSILAFADEYCRSSIDHTVVEIGTVPADPADAASLEVAPGSPLLRLVETHYDSDVRPIAVSDIRLVDRLLPLTVVRKRT